MNCDNCEKPRVCPDDCGPYQDLWAENKTLKRRVLAQAALIEFLR